MSKILLVEDDNFLRSLFKQKLLQRAGWTVVAAKNGEEGIKKALTEKPNLILLDLMLPDSCGFDILERIKQDKNLKNIPVIIMSALEQDSDIQNCLKRGAVDYLKKSTTSFDSIIDKVEKHLSK